MTLADPNHIANSVLNSSRLLLSDLPSNQHGLYALFDDRGQIRYVGQTACQGGYRDRIYNKHVTGSTHGASGRSGRSHKYASEYMPLKGRKAAPGFVRAHCRATIFPIPGRPLGVPQSDPSLKAYKASLCSLEEQVIATIRACGFALDWNEQA